MGESAGFDVYMNVGVEKDGKANCTLGFLFFKVGLNWCLFFLLLKDKKSYAILSVPHFLPLKAI